MENEIEILRTALQTNRKVVGGYRALARTAKLSPSWVYKFVEGHIEEPRRANLVKLRKALLSMKVKLDPVKPATEPSLAVTPIETD